MSLESLIEIALKAITVNRSNLRIMHNRATDILEDIQVGLDAVLKAMGDAAIRKDADSVRAQSEEREKQLSPPSSHTLNDLSTVIAKIEKARETAIAAFGEPSDSYYWGVECALKILREHTPSEIRLPKESERRP